MKYLHLLFIFSISVNTVNLTQTTNYLLKMNVTDIDLAGDNRARDYTLSCKNFI